jgi:hypothetical protein
MSIYNNITDHPTPIYIDSSERVSGTDSAFLSAPVLINAGNSYDAVVVSQVSIPKSWYNVPARFNYLYLVENGNTITISLPAGNYNRNNMATVLSALLTSSSVSGKTYTLSYPNVNIQADTGKYTFSYTPFNLGDTISIDVDDVSMFQQLGFNRNSTNSFNDITGQLVSSNVINFQIINSIFITSDMCVEEGTLQELHNVGINLSNSYIFFQQYNFDLTSKQLLTNSQNSWTFALTDEFDREVDLNGVPWEMSLIIYNRTDTHQLQKEELKIKNLEKILENELKIKNI